MVIFPLWKLFQAIFWVTRPKKFEKIEFSKMPLDCRIEPYFGQNRDFCVFLWRKWWVFLTKIDFISFIRKIGHFRHKIAQKIIKIAITRQRKIHLGIQWAHLLQRKFLLFLVTFFQKFIFDPKMDQRCFLLLWVKKSKISKVQKNAKKFFDFSNFRHILERKNFKKHFCPFFSNCQIHHFDKLGA